MSKDDYIFEFTFVICSKCTSHIDTDKLDRNEGYCPVCGKQLCTYKEHNDKERVILT